MTNCKTIQTRKAMDWSKYKTSNKKHIWYTVYTVHYNLQPEYLQ